MKGLSPEIGLDRVREESPGNDGQSQRGMFRCSKSHKAAQQAFGVVAAKPLNKGELSECKIIFRRNVIA
jgi:hypothetical protein